MVLSRKEVGLLIKKAREYKSKIINKKYTQKMLAEDLNISRGYIGDIENGRTYPNYVLLSKITKICEVPFGFFDEANKSIGAESLSVIDEPNTNSIHLENSNLNYPIISDVKQAMELILSQPSLMLNGELLNDESKIAIANAIQMGLAYAEKIQKKEVNKLEDK